MPATRRVVLHLPVEQADRIDAEVAAGRYPSADAFVAARLAEEDEPPPELARCDWVALADAAADEGLRMEAGEVEVRPAAAVFSELEDRIRARAAAR